MYETHFTGQSVVLVAAYSCFDDLRVSENGSEVWIPYLEHSKCNTRAWRQDSEPKCCTAQVLGKV